MLSHRTILVAIAVFSLLTLVGMQETRLSLVIAVVLLNVVAWSWPLIVQWRQSKNRLLIEGERQLRIGNYGEAERALESAAAEATAKSVPALKQSEILLKLAEARRKQERLQDAEHTVRQAMQLVVDGKGPARSQYGNCLELLAAIFEDDGNYPQAQNMLREALSVEESLPRPGDEILAKRRLKLALAHHNAGDYAAAAPHFEDALQLHHRAFGPEHPETAVMLAEAGAALSRESNHAGATERLEQALKIREKVFGAGSPEVVAILNTLALSYERSGKVEQAAAHFERLLRLHQLQVGANEIELGAVLSHVARVNLVLGRLARAEETAQAAVLIFERKPGAELMAVLDTLSKIYERTDRYQEAAALRERIEFIRKGQQKPPDPLLRRPAIA